MVLAAARKPINLSLDPMLVEEARSLGVNLSRAAEQGVSEALRQAKAEAWNRENAEAIRSSNEWIERNGLPLKRYRPA